jgi:flavoprotein
MDVIRDGIIKTRKDHKCHGCEEIIPKGTKTYSQTNVDDTIYTLYVCNSCREYCGNCHECYETENAYEGYIRECKIDGGR